MEDAPVAAHDSQNTSDLSALNHSSGCLNHWVKKRHTNGICRQHAGLITGGNHRLRIRDIRRDGFLT
jgi:hypothetical protein